MKGGKEREGEGRGEEGEGRRGEREGGQEGAFADTVTSCSVHWVSADLRWAMNCWCVHIFSSGRSGERPLLME